MAASIAVMAACPVACGVDGQVQSLLTSVDLAVEVIQQAIEHYKSGALYRATLTQTY